MRTTGRVTPEGYGFNQMATTWEYIRTGTHSSRPAETSHSLQPATGVTHSSEVAGGQDASWSRALRSVGPKVRSRLRIPSPIRQSRHKTPIRRSGKVRCVSSPRLERVPTRSRAFAQPFFQTKHKENCVVRMRRAYIAPYSVPNDIGGAESTDRRTGRHDIMQTASRPVPAITETATAPSSKPHMGAHLGYMAEKQPQCRRPWARASVALHQRPKSAIHKPLRNRR